MTTQDPLAALLARHADCQGYCEVWAERDAIAALAATPPAIDPEVRPAVRWFAGEMERQLRDNDHKGGWQDCDIDWLMKRLVEETGELYAALHDLWEGRSHHTAAVVEEAADVANFALMVADNIAPHEDASLDRPAIDPDRLARAIADHDDICSRMAIPECAAAIIAAYEADTDA